MKTGKIDKTTKGLAFLTLGNKYLQLVKNILEENIKGGQRPVDSYDHTPTAEELYKDLKWRFHQIILPMLFNFYHEIELTIKGFLVLLPTYNGYKNHKLTNLLKDFSDNYRQQYKIIGFLKKYIEVNRMPPYLKTWIEKHNLAIDDYYDFLKYPFDLNFEKYYDYFELKYDSSHQNQGIDFSKSMYDDIKSFLPEIGIEIRKLAEDARSAV